MRPSPRDFPSLKSAKWLLTNKKMDTDEIIAKGRRCIDIEADALKKTSEQLDSGFAAVASALIETVNQGNKLILSGIGKSAHIAQKLVGTLNSIGAPASFLDPVNALHGDMGLCREGDALLAFSNSGETEELLRLVPLISRFNVICIAVTSKKDSSLAQLCQNSLVYSADKEACPLDLAPTASSTACMAIGDAVAMVILEGRAFSKEDFARFHPGGSLGKSLAVSVNGIMRSPGEFAQLSDTASCKDCLKQMTNPNSGCIALTDHDGKLSGVFTDGDIRRLVLTDADFLSKPVSTFMTRNPIIIRSGSLAVEALRVFESLKIDDLIVVDEHGAPIGVIDGQDLTKVRMV